MKYLKDVIVRKRPLPPSGGRHDADEAEQVSEFFDLDAVRARLQKAEDIQEQASDISGSSPRGEATHPVDATATAASRKQIWDIEEGDRADDADRSPPTQSRRPPASELAGEAPAAGIRTGLDREVGKYLSTSTAARAKTRIIGFHAAGVDADVFAAERAAPAAKGQFPAGWLVVIDGPGRGASFTIGAGVSTIGRGADQTVCLDFGDTSISRENHAAIAYDEEQNRFFVGHGGKSNIVRRNGNPVLATEDLADADLIRIGKTTLRFVALCGTDFTWDSAEDRQDTDAPES